MSRARGVLDKIIVTPALGGFHIPSPQGTTCLRLAERPSIVILALDARGSVRALKNKEDWLGSYRLRNHANTPSSPMRTTGPPFFISSSLFTVQ